MASAAKNEYRPTSVSPPGETLAELLAERGMLQRELAERTGTPAKTINEIIKGNALITPETALQFERVLGTPSAFWNARERAYREWLARRTQVSASPVSLPGPGFFDALREFFRNLGDPSTILVAPWETGFARRGNAPEANSPEQRPGVQVGTVTGQGLAEMGTAWKLTMPGRGTCVAQLHEDGILLNAGKDVLKQLESTKVTFSVLEDGNAFIRFPVAPSTSKP